MLCEIKTPTNEKDAGIQRWGLALDLVCELKRCTPAHAERHHEPLIKRFANLDALYLVGRIDGLRLCRLQEQKDHLESLLRSLSWYSESSGQSVRAEIRNVYTEAIKQLEEVNREIERYCGKERSGNSGTVPK